MTVTRMQGINGETKGWVGTLADVTAEVYAEKAVEASRDAALAASVREKDFAASASHELRTPTTSILGYLEAVLESASLNEQDRHFLEIVDRNAHRLNQLIDDLLVIDRVDFGASLMNLEPVAIIPIVEDLILAFSATAKAAGVDLVTKYKSPDLIAFADAFRLEQVLTNLISNALKFTPNGGVVKIIVDADDNTVRVSVVDSGIGIEPEDIDKIFNRFHRTRRGIDTGAKGSGLGLAIAKGMIEAQNGDITVTSIPGSGSTFALSLPIA